MSVKGFPVALHGPFNGLPRAFQRPSKNPPKGRTMAKQGPYNYIPRTLRASYKGNRSLHGDVVLSSLVLPQVQVRELEKILCVFHAAAVPRTHMQRHCRVEKNTKIKTRMQRQCRTFSMCSPFFVFVFFVLGVGGEGGQGHV